MDSTFKVTPTHIVFLRVSTASSQALPHPRSMGVYLSRYNWAFVRSFKPNVILHESRLVDFLGAALSLNTLRLVATRSVCGFPLPQKVPTSLAMVKILAIRPSERYDTSLVLKPRPKVARVSFDCFQICVTDSRAGSPFCTCTTTEVYVRNL